MDPLALTLVGTPEVRYEGRPLSLQHRHIALISYIALQGRPCGRDELSEVLWGQGRSANLRVALSKLRKQPGAEYWLEDGERLSVRVRSDVDIFEEALGQDSLSADVLGHLERVADPEGGRLLLGLSVPTPAYEAWLAEQRQRIDALVESLLLSAAEHLHEQGQVVRARAFAEKLLKRDSLGEEAYRLLMRLEVARGQPEAAQGVFERLRRTLKEQLGEEPSEETRALHKQLLGTGASARARYLRLGDPMPGKAEHLFGRAELLERFSTALDADPVLLHGLGGVGKTALAAEIASVHLQKGDVLWLQAGLSGAEELLEVAGQALQLRGAASEPGRLKDALSGGAVGLLVVDDAWDEMALRALRVHLPEDLPLLVTARQRFAKLERFDVGVLPRDDAHQLLEHAAGRPLPAEESGGLCAVLGDHPFALRLAGAKLKQDRLTPTQLLAQLADAPHQLVSPKGWRESGRESVSALLQASLETLSDDAYYAFLAVGALASGGTTAPLLAGVLQRDPDVIEAALIELHTRALAERVATPGSDLVRYALHDLSHSFARENNIVRPRTVTRACQSFVRDNARNFEALDVELGNLIGALEVMRGASDGEAFVDTMADLAIGDAYFMARGHTTRSLALLEAAVRWAKEKGRLEKAHHFATKQGDTLRVQYRAFAKALDAYTEGAQLARLVNNPGREAISMCLGAMCRYHLGHETEADFDHAYALAQRVDDDEAQGQVLQNRSYVAGLEEDWERVERYSRDAVELARGMSAGENRDRAQADDLLFYSLLTLGEARRKLGAFDHAVRLREEALALATSRDNWLWQAHACSDLGEMYLDDGATEVGYAYLQRATELYTRSHAEAEVREVEAILERASLRRVNA